MQNHNPKAAHKHSMKDFMLLVSVPIIVVLLGAAIMYIPSALAKPTYDFVFQTCSAYDACDNVDYTVDASGKLKTTEKPYQYPNNGTRPDLFYFDVSENTYKKITPEEAQKYKLDSTRKSPDGYTFRAEDTANDFLFGSGEEGGWYLKNGMKKKQIDIDVEPYYYEPSMFLGWVVPQ